MFRLATTLIVMTAVTAPAFPVGSQTAPLTVTNSASSPKRIQVPRSGLKRPLVLEIGAAGRPVRSIPKFVARDAVVFRARPGAAYEVWDEAAYAQRMAARADQVLGGLHGSTARARLRDALRRLRFAHSEEQIALRMDVSRALAALERISVQVRMDYPADLPAEYRVFPLRPFRLTSKLTNNSGTRIRARILRIVYPSDWTLGGATPSRWASVESGGSVAWTRALRAPLGTYPAASYPVAVWFEVSSGGLTWHVEDNCLVRVDPPFQVDVAVRGRTNTTSVAEITLRNNFRGIDLKGVKLEIRPPEGWGAEPRNAELDLRHKSKVALLLTRPSDTGRESDVLTVVCRYGNWASQIRYRLGYGN